MEQIRKLTNVNDRFTQVFAIDDIEYNANHEFHVCPSESALDKGDNGINVFAAIKFQKGPINEVGVNGCHNEDLIAIVIDRLQSFQNSEFKCRENEIAIIKLEEAMLWLNFRTANRQKRGVEGTHHV